MSSEEKEPEEMFEVGFDADPPRFMVIQIPIAKWADDKDNGAALLYGKLREAQALGAQMMQRLRTRKTNLEVIKPGLVS